MLIERMRKRLAADRAAVVEPCLPSAADTPPSGPDWIHEIKHDGFPAHGRARDDPVGIGLLTRSGQRLVARSVCRREAFALWREQARDGRTGLPLRAPCRKAAKCGTSQGRDGAKRGRDVTEL